MFAKFLGVSGLSVVTTALLSLVAFTGDSPAKTAALTGASAPSCCTAKLAALPDCCVAKEACCVEGAACCVGIVWAFADTSGLHRASFPRSLRPDWAHHHQ